MKPACRRGKDITSLSMISISCSHLQTQTYMPFPSLCFPNTFTSQTWPYQCEVSSFNHYDLYITYHWQIMIFYICISLSISTPNSTCHLRSLQMPRCFFKFLVSNILSYWHHQLDGHSSSWMCPLTSRELFDPFWNDVSWACCAAHTDLSRSLLIPEAHELLSFSVRHLDRTHLLVSFRTSKSGGWIHCHY